ncbi:MAG: helix-turn-helix domain-containing protein, partial [Treponema sp.]|nr:helix-turn-helix domain-containing protein [Treponema sp.]
MGMTGKEFAKLMGVSQSTVSMVLNNKPGISEAKRNEILSKMKELNFDGLPKQTSEDTNSALIAFV